ncbi:MAG TPA: chemotaxis protein CheB [Ramlibacter sp.]|jgi:two-component system chemotaxis response regulator CheB|nr:chemotaxis protein CheB [Ramlibacter sp.]
MTVHFDHLVVIGASAGGVTALLEISEGLPRFFGAPVCIVQHIGSNASLLPELLRYKGPNHAMHAEDGQRLATGTLHIAPPDQHMLVQGEVLHVRRGPKENHARPAIDPLFRSAAAAHGPRVIGVVLTGQMDDGTAGLKAIKECGGITIVQDPTTALESSMPRSALANVDVDYCVPLAEIAPLLVRLVGERSPAPAEGVPEHVQREVSINQGEGTVEKLEGIATPSLLTCPDCGGGLWEMKDQKPLRYRCHTGHAYGALSLQAAQKESAEHALWSTVRALREREILLRRLAGIAAATGDSAQASAGQAQADRLSRQIETLQELAETAPAGIEHDADA